MSIFSSVSGFNNVADRYMGNSRSTFNGNETFIYKNVVGLFLLTNITILYCMAQQQDLYVHKK